MEDIEQDLTCVICTESEYSDETSHFISDCGHHFHYNCLRQWCYINNSCPTCRKKNILGINELSVCVPESQLNTGFMFHQLWSNGSTATTVSNASPNYNENNLNNNLIISNNNNYIFNNLINNINANNNINHNNISQRFMNVVNRFNRINEDAYNYPVLQENLPNVN